MSEGQNKSPSPSGEGLGWGSSKERERQLLDRAAEMRRLPTEPEKRLWRALSNAKLDGFKFRRQAVIGDRIVDFFCPSIGLIVEIDGDTHVEAVDIARDRRAAEQGLQTLRFSNADVMHNIEGVCAALLETAQSLPARREWRLPHPNPSPEGERL